MFDIIVVCSCSVDPSEEIVALNLRVFWSIFLNNFRLSIM